ncbi:MAG: DUF2207 domain-containing protein [Nitrospirae bacterium]|nr:DUF2207 domain-containing protein [Nitrospirota bacterium]
MIRKILVALLLFLILIVIVGTIGLFGLGKRINAPGLDVLMSRIAGENRQGSGPFPDTTLPGNIEEIAGTWKGISDVDGTTWQFTFEKNFAVRAASSSGYVRQGTAFVHWKLGLTDGLVRVPPGWSPLDVDIIDSTEPLHRNTFSLGAFSLKGKILQYCFSEPGKMVRPINDLSREGIRCFDLSRAAAGSEGVSQGVVTPAPMPPITPLTEAVPGSSAHTRVRVTNFHANILIQADGNIHVQETMQVLTAGAAFEQKKGALLTGIYRAIGGRVQGQHAYYRLMGFEMKGAALDGQPIPYRVETSGRWFTHYVFLGPERFTLSPGVHEFAIEYAVDRHIRFLPDHDELFWWVFGKGMHGWAESVGTIGATVLLPYGTSGVIASLEDHSWNAGTGKIPELLRQAAASESANVLHYDKVISKKHPYLSVVVSMPKGAVSGPDLDQRVIFFLRDMSAYWAGVIGLTVFFAYYLFAWVRVGRDPEVPSIVPRYKPPADCSPAIARRLVTMGYDRTAFSSALLNLAAEGLLRLTSQAGRYFVKRTEKQAVGLAPDETTLLEALFKSSSGSAPQRSRQELDAITIHRAYRAHRRALRLMVNRQYFTRNLLYVIPAVLISLGVVAINAEIVDIGGTYIRELIGLGLWMLLTGFITRFLMRKKVLELRKPSKLVYLALLFPPVLYAVAVVVSQSVEVFNIMKFMFFVPLFIMMTGHVVFIFLLRAPTELGRKALDEIEGFRIFLARAEGDRLDRLHPPEKTPALFQAYMPYALALGVENRWSEQFSGEIDETYTLPPLDLFLSAISRLFTK